MQRRTLLKLATFGGFASAPVSRLFGEPRGLFDNVHTVLLVAKCHLDIGFTNTQSQVMHQYFDVHYPKAIETAAAMRRAGDDHYSWTTGSWLLYEYLEQANKVQRKAMEEAIANRDVAWHALPFSWQTEMFDRSMVAGALSFSRTLDRRFGVHTKGSKMTDVPGHSRGIVGPLADAGVRLLDIGVNAASTPPDVPELFLWKDTAGQSLAVLYHRHDYGGTVVIPGTGFAVDVEVRGDNSGPHTQEEIATIYSKLRTQFPGARIRAATMNDVATAVDRVRDALPVVSSEIGDSWIYGCASDPYKISRYRSLARLRRTWIKQARFTTGDATDRALLRRVLLAAEHTWGTDTKTYLDDDHYLPADLATVLDRPGYVTMETSWKEKRDNLETGIAGLPPALQQQAQAAFLSLDAKPISVAGMSQHDAAAEFETRYYRVAFDPATGAITGLRNKVTKAEWASTQNPVALFTYQTLSSEQYASFMKRYLKTDTAWAPQDFSKPGIDRFGANAREWHPTDVRCFRSSSANEDRVVLDMEIIDPTSQATGCVAWPRRIFTELRFPAASACIDFRVVTLGKSPNRLPEAMWLTFKPSSVAAGSWEMDKVTHTVSASDIVPGGGRNMHAVSDLIRCRNTAGQTFQLHTFDAPVVAFGERSPLNFSRQLPDFALGAHVCLFSNAWGTNYPQWCGGDWLYRFQLYA